MTATLYSFSDPGAPQFVDNDSASNLAIIKAVLIDGYGSRTPTGGWTLAFEDVPSGIICLQPQEVGAPLLQLEQGTNEMSLSARGFATMSSATVGTNPFPTPVQAPIYQVPIRQSTSLNGATTYWWMIVDDDGEYFYFLSNNDTGFFYGKMNFDPAAQARWVLAGVNSDMNTSTNDRALFSNTSNLYCNLNTGGGPEGSRVNKVNINFAMRQPNLASSDLFTTRPYALESTTSQYLGLFPGWLYVDGGSLSPIFNGSSFAVVSGRNFKVMEIFGTANLFEYNAG